MEGFAPRGTPLNAAVTAALPSCDRACTTSAGPFAIAVRAFASGDRPGTAGRGARSLTGTGMPPSPLNDHL
jgi:hypothetical protein